MIRTSHLLAAVLLASTLSGAARADEKQACSKAYGQAQTLRDQHKLLAARDELRVCGRSTCPGFIAKDCAAWLAEVEAALPSVVFGAKDPAGADVTDVKVTMDGAVVATAIDGRAIAVDPGSHAFVFEKKDGTRAAIDVVVREGVKAQQVAVSIGRAAPPPPAPPPAAREPAPVPSAVDAPAEPHGSRPLRTIGFVAGGLGIVGLGIGAIFGAQAISKNSDAQCNSDNFCANPDARTDAQSAATISTIGFVAGAALLAGGVVLVLTSRDRGGAHAARVEAVPMIGSTGGSLVLRGSL